ncbi:hypothetical protein J2X13_002050 [Aminobacter aminovorans]|jgi:hypothetical protein|nr:hypothetical protein [Aminobacter aminovorans]
MTGRFGAADSAGSKGLTLPLKQAGISRKEQTP